MPSLKQVLVEAAQRLQHLESSRLEAELLLCHVLGKDRGWLYGFSDEDLAQEQAEVFAALLARRERGEPLAYILGERDFWSFSLAVTPAVLIPRADTEVLVETALSQFEDRPLRVLDLGTGSGAIALALAAERPQWSLEAVDRSGEAVAVARENCQRLALANVAIYESDWFSSVPANDFDLIVSNPPYIAAGDPHLQQGDLPHEPATALVAGADGLSDIAHIIEQAPAFLINGGWLMLEHGYDQGEKVRSLLRREFSQVKSVRDLGGNERVSCGCLSRS